MFRTGDRVALRDRPWRVRGAELVAGESQLLDLEALDGDVPEALRIVSPPEHPVALPGNELRFDVAAIDAAAPWFRAHFLIDRTCVRDTGLPAAAGCARVLPETYQLVPTQRLLAKPRSSLLVADDVGLGKTIEAGLALLELMARGRVRRVLVVAPPGLVQQWRQELYDKFALEFEVIENAAGLSRTQSRLPAGVSPWDALPRVITSIDYLKKDTVRGRALRKKWDFIIVDEAHALAEAGTPSNPYRTQRTRLGTALRDHARSLLLLTATPHNGYGHSFRSLLELVEPSMATLEGDPTVVHRRVALAMVRRMKDQIVRHLPDGGTERVFPVRTVRGIGVPPSGFTKVLAKVASYCSKTAKAADGTEDEDLVGFAMQIVKKRALSGRRALETTIANRIQALRKEDAREAPPERHELRDLQADLPLGEAQAERTALRIVRSAVPPDEKRRKSELRALNEIQKLLKSSGDVDPKADALLAHIAEVLAADAGEKFIVFTEYLDTLASIAERFDADPALSGHYVVLRGGMSSTQRLKVQERFEDSTTRVLLATDAASEGLNLQRSCRRVIHVELPWNPNRLEQRNGRVDRYGQTRPPEIRYLFHPESPEEQVLDQLIRKLEEMIEDRVSTPDILGVLGGGDLDRSLTHLDPEEPDVAERVEGLVRRFEDRTREFVRDVVPLLALQDASPGAVDADDARVVLDDDLDLERVVLAELGPSAVQPGPVAGTYRLSIPAPFRGEGVEAAYVAATFRRSVAVRYRPQEVEFIHAVHPLVRAMSSIARSRMLHGTSSSGGPAARRMSVVPDAAIPRPVARFTFLATVAAAGRVVEERVLAVDVDVAGQPAMPVSTSWSAGAGASYGNVTRDSVRDTFESVFPQLAGAAKRIASERVAELVADARRRRVGIANACVADVDRDLEDRLHEIDDEERRARGLVEETGQGRLFAALPVSDKSFAARREAARLVSRQRRDELQEFAAVGEPVAPHALGVLLMMPNGAQS
jgi:superfamily II DNA or RNA helicase